MMQRVTITSSCYRIQYHTFSRSLAWSRAICDALTRIAVKFIKKIYINIFFKKMTVTRGKALQIAQSQGNVRENIR